VLRSISRSTAEGKQQFFDVQVTRVQDPTAGTVGTSVQYVDVTEYQQVKNELISLNQQLQTANEELQSAHEELETTNEELQSTNEELETTNEELQSTNEELQTMNEELHSANLELASTNTSQTQLTDQMNSSNKFIEAILGSIDAAIIVLSSSFQIKIWNRTAEEMFGLRAQEVTDQNFFSLDIGLPVEKLKSPLREFVVSGKQTETLTLDAVNRRGRALVCRVRLSPLAHGNTGVILIIDDADRAKGNGAHG
jgi:two-component system CheB/CheR fusion protein